MASDANLPEDGEALTGNTELAQFNVQGQYIKDFSFESPNVPNVLLKKIENPNLQIGVNVNAEKLGENQYEVVINLEADATGDDVGAIYKLELVYAGIFLLRNIPEDVLRPMLLVNCPALLFPFVRRIVADTTRDAAFPPLLLDPIDFAGLYRANLAKEQQGIPANAIN